MASVKKWSNVAIAMQSALAAAKTITGITKAAPGVVSSTAHGYSNGDYVYLEVLGMWQLNGRVFRVCNVATDSFRLEAVSGGEVGVHRRVGGIDAEDDIEGDALGSEFL